MTTDRTNHTDDPDGPTSDEQLLEDWRRLMLVESIQDFVRAVKRLVLLGGGDITRIEWGTRQIEWATRQIPDEGE